MGVHLLPPWSPSLHYPLSLIHSPPAPAPATPSEPSHSTQPHGTRALCHPRALSLPLLPHSSAPVLPFRLLTASPLASLCSSHTKPLPFLRQGRRACRVLVPEGASPFRTQAGTGTEESSWPPTAGPPLPFSDLHPPLSETPSVTPSFSPPESELLEGRGL